MSGPSEPGDLLTLLAELEAAKPAAFAGAEVADENADDWWRSSALQAVETLARSGVEFTADDVRDMGVTEPDHPNRWGGVFLAASRGGLIEPVGARRSTRGPRNASLVRVWRGVAA
jgi:hypothetical protein